MSSTPPIQARTPVTAQQVEQKFYDYSVEALQELCRVNFERMSKYKTDPSILLKGSYYPNENYLALKEVGLTEQIEAFKKSGHFYHGYLPTDFFVHQTSFRSPTGYEFEHWIVKEGVDPCAAMDALDRDLALIGCSLALDKVCLVALRRLFGDAKFSAVFSYNSETPLTLSGNNVPVYSFLFEAGEGEPAVKRGSHVYFHGIAPLYCAKHLNGEAQGYNTLALGNGKYIGFGLPPEGATQEEINQKLIKEYNRDPISLEFVSDEIGRRILNHVTPAQKEKLELFKDHQITKEDYQKYKGGRATLVVRKLASERLTQLINSSIPEAKALMEKWSYESETSLGYVLRVMHYYYKRIIIFASMEG